MKIGQFYYPILLLVNCYFTLGAKYVSRKVDCVITWDGQLTKNEIKKGKVTKNGRNSCMKQSKTTEDKKTI